MNLNHHHKTAPCASQQVYLHIIYHAQQLLYAHTYFLCLLLLMILAIILYGLTALFTDLLFFFTHTSISFYHYYYYHSLIVCYCYKTHTHSTLQNISLQITRDFHYIRKVKKKMEHYHD